MGSINQTPTELFKVGLMNQTPTLKKYILCRCLIYQTHIFDPINKKVALMNQAPTNKSTPTLKKGGFDESIAYI